MGQRRLELRGYLQKKSGDRPEKPTIARGKPANAYYAGTEYKLAAKDQRKLYSLIARHLRLAEALIEQDDLAVRQSGVVLVRQTIGGAMFHLKDDELAYRIADAWLLPATELAEQKRGSLISRDAILSLTLTVAGRAGHYDEMAAVARQLRDSTTDLERSDAARWQLVTALEKLGRIDEAIAVLREIRDDGEMAGVKQRIPILQEKLKNTTKEPPHAPSKK